MEKNNFLYHYQTLLFKESNNQNNSCLRAHLKRQSMNQFVLAGNEGLSNETSCHILKNKLREYSSLVDKHNGVNNYASGVLNLVAHSVNDAQKWTSESKASLLLEKYLKPLEDGCPNLSNGSCTAQKPSQSELEAFLKTKKTFPNQVTDNSSCLKIQGPLNDIKKTSVNVGNPCSSATSLSAKRTVTFMSKRPTETSSGGFRRTDSKVMTAIESKVFGTGRIPSHNQPTSRQAENKTNVPAFRTAGTELKLQNFKKYGQQGQSSNDNSRELAYGNNKKSLGGRPRGINSKFVPPIKSNSQDDELSEPNLCEEELEDERLRLIDPKMIELIRSEIMDHGPPVQWSDIAGLLYAKATIQEIVVLPMLRPDIFTGLRRPPKGILLFGPPGTGKTLIGKCIASQSKSTFFNISASSLTSKWVGEGEKMVRTLFTLARIHQPAVVFIDEIDSLLSQRSESEHESSRRIKTEFLVQLDGAGTGEDDRILVIGATNRPQELDEAARRRLVKRLYIPLPDQQARCQIVENLMRSERNDLTNEQIEEVASLTDGYSGADMKTVCQEACLGPIRSISFNDMQHITPDQVRPVTVEDFKTAITRVRSSVSPKDLDAYLVWDQTYGAGGAPK